VLILQCWKVYIHSEYSLAFQIIFLLMKDLPFGHPGDPSHHFQGLIHGDPWLCGADGRSRSRCSIQISFGSDSSHPELGHTQRRAIRGLIWGGYYYHRCTSHGLNSSNTTMLASIACTTMAVAKENFPGTLICFLLNQKEIRSYLYIYK
jgi:hypothetical protein